MWVTHSFIIQNHTRTTHKYNKMMYTWGGTSGARGHSAKYATRNIPEAQYAFKGLMIHEVMQFALRIAFRCVLHRCGSQDIHR